MQETTPTHISIHTPGRLGTSVCLRCLPAAGPRTPSPISIFSLSFSRCLLVVCGVCGLAWFQIAAASTIPINRNMCIVDNLAVQLQVFPRDFLILLRILVQSCGYSVSCLDIY